MFDFLPALAWALVGLVLLIAELATSRFICVFIGMGALIVAAAKKCGLDLHLHSAAN